jgi:hypothetical protein
VILVLTNTCLRADNIEDAVNDTLSHGVSDTTGASP